jgi:hypothetical protein
MVKQQLTNQQFLERHAAPGLVGLVGGSALVDRTIRRAQRGLVGDECDSAWSHAFLFGGRRADGQHWVFESDIEIHHKHIRLGVQENRAQKYWDDDAYPNLAVLDFGLDEEAVRCVLTEALDLLAGRTRYSLRELVGTMLAMKRASLRSRTNVLAREGALYCSAFVQHCYARAGIEFVGGLATKNTTPQDIAACRAARKQHRLIRQATNSVLRLR